MCLVAHLTDVHVDVGASQFKLQLKFHELEIHCQNCHLAVATRGELRYLVIHGSK